MAKAKVVLGKRPEFIELTVRADVPDGEAEVKVKYVYRTHTEYGKMMDELTGSIGVRQSEETIEALTKLNRDQRAGQILKIVKGWDLEAEVTKSNVEQLCDEFPGLALAIILRYRDAIVDGRLGN